MARNMRAESEFGLGVMPRATADGDVVAAGDAAGRLPLAGNDAEAVAAGADLSLADELRIIYSSDPDRLPS